jgi:hypothetical protein
MLQVIVARSNFRGRRFVFRRHTLDRVGNAAIGKPQAIARMRRGWLVGETKPVQRSIQQQAGMIAGERSSGAIRPMHTRGEPNDQQTRMRIAERCNRARMVVRVLGTHRIQVFSQTRTAAAV